MSQMLEVPVQTTQDKFVQMMPHIERIAGHVFKHINPVDREEAVAETVAMCWKNYLHCVLAGKDVKASSMAFYAVQTVKSGRSMCGGSGTDALSQPARTLPGHPAESAQGCGWPDALVDTRVWERPLEHTRIKLDYGQFLQLPEVTEQERGVFELLAQGFRTSEIAQYLGVSAPRVCQIKNSMGEKLLAFFGQGIWPVSSRGRGRPVGARR